MKVSCLTKRIFCMTGSKSDKYYSDDDSINIASTTRLSRSITSHRTNLDDDDKNDATSHLCKKLHDIAKANNKTLDSIEARFNMQYTSGYTISLDCRMPPPPPPSSSSSTAITTTQSPSSSPSPWTINTTKIVNTVKSCIDAWEYDGTPLYTPEKAFDGGIDHKLKTYDDVRRLNAALPHAGTRYASILNDGECAQVVLKAYVTNMVRVRNAVEDVYELTLDREDDLVANPRYYARLCEGMRLLSAGFDKLAMELPSSRMILSANGYVGHESLVEGVTSFVKPQDLSRRMALKGHEAIVRDVIYYEGGGGGGKMAFLASASQDATIKIWTMNNDGNNDAATTATAETTLSSTTLTGHKGCVYALVKYERESDGTPCMASASYDKRIILWNLTKHSIITKLKGHKGYVYALATYRDDNNTLCLASGCSDRTIKIWNLVTNKFVKNIKGVADQVLSLATFRQRRHADDNNNTTTTTTPYLVCGCSDKTINIYNLSTNTITARLKGHASYISKLVTYTNDEGTICLASGSWDKTIKLWNLVDYRLIATLRDAKQMMGHVSALTSFGHNGIPCLASGDTSGCVKMWNLIDHRCLRTIQGTSGSVFCVYDFRHGDKPWLAFGGKDVELWTE